MENIQSNRQQTGDTIYASRLLIDENKTPGEVVDALVARSLSQSSATSLVDHLQWQMKKAKKEKAEKNMMIGGVFFFAGLVITAGSYLMASDTGGVFFLAWGAILFGGIQFFIGVNNRR